MTLAPHSKSKEPVELVLCLCFAEPAQKLPSGGQGKCRQGKLEKIADNKRIKPEQEGLFPTDEVDEPGKANSVDENVSREHRQRRAPNPAVPSALSKEPYHERRGDKSHKVTAGWAGKACQACASSGEDRKAYGTFYEVEKDGETTPRASKQSTYKQNSKGLPGNGNRTERKGYRHLGKQGDERTSYHHEYRIVEQPHASVHDGRPQYVSKRHVTTSENVHL